MYLIYMCVYDCVCVCVCVCVCMGFPGGSDSEKSTSSAGDPDSILELGRSAGEENGNLL